MTKNKMQHAAPVIYANNISGGGVAHVTCNWFACHLFVFGVKLKTKTHTYEIYCAKPPPSEIDFRTWAYAERDIDVCVCDQTVGSIFARKIIIIVCLNVYILYCSDWFSVKARHILRCVYLFPRGKLLSPGQGARFNLYTYFVVCGYIYLPAI